MKATQGITAGSGLATTELKLLLLDVIQEAQAGFGDTLEITLYVDDMTLSASGTAKTVASILAKATDCVVRHFRKLGMIVSEKKSVTVASSHDLARKTAAGAATKSIRPRKSAKLLGVGTAGGKKRNVKTLSERISKVSKLVPRLQVLRKRKVNTRLMARACGTAAITYGVDCQGVARGMLQKMRTTIAAAASTGTSGKNTDRVLHYCDGLSGTLDPAVDALTLGLQRWATTWWEQWTARESMKLAYEGACEKCCKLGYKWRHVAGPAAALAVALTEIGWDWIAANKFKDDNGREWSASLDPPICIAKAAKKSVRKWRMQKTEKSLPGLLPATNDADDKWLTGRSVLLDLSRVTSRIACGKVDRLPQAPEFNRRFAPSLMSAVAGGQWTQSRCASVPSFGITHNRCQLCMKETGTAAHRWNCECTKPENGWSQPAGKAEQAFQVIGERRLQLLETHGMLVLKVPAKPRLP